MINRILLTRSIIFSICAGVTALIWDGWWHVAVGRETFLEPPHIVLYFSVMFAVVAAVYGWFKTKEVVWRHLAVTTFFVPLSAPFDDAWHRLFGVENLNSTLIIWSPPHLVLFGSLVASFIMVLPLLRKDTVTAQQVFGAYIFAVITAILFGVIAPFYPFGPFILLGFWGAGILAAVLVGIYIAANAWLPKPGGATSVALVFLSLYFLQNAETIAPGVVIPNFPHPPPFFLFFSTLLPALIIDSNKFSLPIRGNLGGLVYGIVLYGFSSQFLQAVFHYSFQNGMIAIFTSIVGGMLGALIVSVFLKQ